MVVFDKEKHQITPEMIWWVSIILFEDFLTTPGLILQAIIENEGIAYSYTQIQEQLRLQGLTYHYQTIFKIVNQLVEAGYLEKKGSNHNTVFYLKEDLLQKCIDIKERSVRDAEW